MPTNGYNPEKYWTEVGERIGSREDDNVIAGDDEPYYRYKRVEFLKMLLEIDVKDKSVLEIGSGPGGNLYELLKLNPSKLSGADLSHQMIALARKKLPDHVELTKVDGKVLPFTDKSFDIVFTATVLQHNTDDDMLRNVIKELSRVSGDKVYLFEKIDTTLKGDELCMGRPVSYYSSIMNDHGFVLKSSKFINIRMSYYVSGAIRKLFNPKSRKEGEPFTKTALFLQNMTLPLTKILDKIFTSKLDIARLEYKRK